MRPMTTRKYLRLLTRPLYAALFVSLVTGCSTPREATPAAGISEATSATGYVGTYTRKEGHVNGQAAGIYRANFDLETGSMTGVELVADAIINPSFVTYDAATSTLFAVSELAQPGEATGYLHVYDAAADGLKETQKLPTNGLAPCHVELNPGGEFVVVSNYVGGVAMLYQRSPGGLTAVDTFNVPEAAKMGKSSWLHSANFSPDGSVVCIADKGLDKVWAFTLDTGTGQLVPTQQVAVDLAAGAGPRHTAWSAAGDVLYVINELDNTINTLAYDKAAMRFSNTQTISTLPAGYGEVSYCADIHLHPSGKFLYGSNRGHDSIAAYAVNPADGTLTLIELEPTAGAFPRNFAIGPNGAHLFVANQNTSTVATLAIDARDGSLSFVGTSDAVPTPVCIEWTE